MDSSTCVSAAKGGNRFEWTGNFQDLSRQILFGAGLLWNMDSTNRRGKCLLFTNKLFTCICFATKKSLLIPESSDIKDKLKQALVYRIPLIATKNESESERKAHVDTCTSGAF